jgi:hypothetical protein
MTVQASLPLSVTQALASLSLPDLNSLLISFRGCEAGYT